VFGHSKESFFLVSIGCYGLLTVTMGTRSGFLNFDERFGKDSEYQCSNFIAGLRSARDIFGPIPKKSFK